MLKEIFIGLILLNYSHKASSEVPKPIFPPVSCEEKMVSTANMPKNNNQGVLEWCFAMTATEMISFYEETPLSYFDLALQYHTHDDLRDNEVKDYSKVGGDNDLALVVAIQSSKGLCLEKDTNFTNGDWAKLSELFKKISSPKKTLKEIVCQNKLIDTEPFEDLDADVFNILNQLSHDKKAAALLDVACKNRHRLKYRYGTAERDIRDYPQEKLISKLDELLSKKEPATIALDIDIIKYGQNYARKSDNHSGTIIGKRPNKDTGECEYLLKYNYSNKCPKKEKIECDNGNFWIPKKTLENNIYRINWLVRSSRK